MRSARNLTERRERLDKFFVFGEEGSQRAVLRFILEKEAQLRYFHWIERDRDAGRGSVEHGHERHAARELVMHRFPVRAFFRHKATELEKLEVLADVGRTGVERSSEIGS